MGTGKLSSKSSKKTSNKKISNYHDYVIKDGKFIGEFEKMYKNFSDPWKYISIGKNNIDHKIIIEFCNYVSNLENRNLKILEMGCGYGLLSYALARRGFQTYGFDISSTAIKKGKKLFANKNLNLFVSRFDDYDKFNKIRPDIYILSDISWYVLPKLKKFISFFKKKQLAYLVHCLAIPETQKYGNKYFNSEESIKKFFNLEILGSANLKYFNKKYKKRSIETHTYFLAKN